MQVNHDTVAIAGASGLIGSALLPLLYSRFKAVRVITRRPLSIDFPQVTQHMVSFADVAGLAQVLTGCQRFAAWRSGGFLAQKFNRRTALEPTTKLSYEALPPPLRQTAVVRSVFFFRLDCLLVVRWNSHILCQVLACVSAGATWQCVRLLSVGIIFFFPYKFVSILKFPLVHYLFLFSKISIH
jgi:hypothetical protein